MMWHTWGMGGWPGWVFMSLAMIVFWGGLIALGVWAFRSAGGSRGDRPESRPNRAMKVLEERYARGEIDQQEFEQRRTVLKG